MLVMKFGGTSVKDPAAITRLAAIVRTARANSQGQGPVVVVSALSKVTDQLVALTDHALKGETGAIATVIDRLRERHVETAAMVSDDKRRAALVTALDTDLNELTSLTHALDVVRDVTPRLQDAIAAIGELLSSRIVAAALEDAGLPTTWVDARRVLITDSSTPAAPLMDETRARCRELLVPLVGAGRIPILGGFIGSTTGGVSTTLGRGRSD